MKKTFWITGASSGIGKAAAILLVSEGHTVFATSRSMEKLDQIAQQTAGMPGKLFVIPGDISNHAEVERVYEEIIKQAHPDVLINCAGITSFKKAEEDNLPDILSVINTNLLGSVFCIKAVLSGFIRKGGGHVINIQSIAATKVLTQSSIYSASKAGLLAYSRVLREEVRKHNIKVTDILPGATITDIWSKNVLDKYSERMMSAEEVAEVILQVTGDKTNLVYEEVILRPRLGDL